MRAAARTGVARRIAALALLAGWVLVTALPAAARPTDFAITAPEPDAILDKAVEITAYVDRTEPPPPEAPGPVEEVDLVTRLLDAENKVIGEERTLQLVDITDTGPGSERLRFRGVLNPSALGWTDKPVVAPNGAYTLQAQWLLRYGDDYSERAEEWKSVPVTFNVPPPPTAAVAGVKSARRQLIEVAWRPVEVPDLIGYRVEASQGDRAWQIVQDDVGPDVTNLVHSADEYGTYRYRVVTRRFAADGTELESVSEETDPVELVEEAPPEPVDDGVGDPSDGDGDGDGDGTQEPDQSSGSTPPPLTPPPAPQVSASPPPPAPAGANTQFDPLIDYGVDVTGKRTERVAVGTPQNPGAGTVGDGGVLSVDTGGGPPQRVLSAVAGGLVLLLAAGHVVRFLNA